MDRGPSSRADTRDLRKISLGVYPELAEGVEMTSCVALRRGVWPRKKFFGFIVL